MRDGTYIIGIDEALPQADYKKVLGHELAHVFLDHLEQPEPVTRAQEQAANDAAGFYYREYITGNLNCREETQNETQRKARGSPL